MLDAYILALALIVLPVEIESSLPNPRVPSLIAEFRSNSFRQREAAHRKLRKVGRGAQWWLEAFKNDRDPEVRYRCHLLLEELYAVPPPPDGKEMPLMCSLSGPLQAVLPYSYPSFVNSRARLVWWYQCRSAHEEKQAYPYWNQDTERHATYLLMRDLRRWGATRESVSNLLWDMNKRSSPIPHQCPQCPQWIAQRWGFVVP